MRRRILVPSVSIYRDNYHDVLLDSTSRFQVTSFDMFDIHVLRFGDKSLDVLNLCLKPYLKFLDLDYLDDRHLFDSKSCESSV